jgi:hypothetical protein
MAPLGVKALPFPPREYTDWTVGTGPEVAGSTLSLLLLLTGRTAAVVDALHGSGVATLKA